MKTAKLASFLALVLVACMLLGACGSGAAQPTSGNDTPTSTKAPAQQGTIGTDIVSGEQKEGVKNISDETFKLGLAGDPLMLVPFQAGTNGATAAELLYDSLIFYNSITKEYEPKLATSWETIDDCTIRYHLRDDVYASDGSKLTAEDVLFTFQMGLLDDYTHTVYSNYDVDNFVIHDDFTIDIVTVKPYCLAFTLLASAEFYIQSKSVCEANGGEQAMYKNPVNGTGPYKLVEWKAGERIVLERKDDYWGELPYYKTIEMYVISDSSARTLALQSGDVDAMQDLPAPMASQVEADEHCEVLSVPSESCLFLGLNYSKEVFQNKLVRQAIAHAINKDAIVQIFASGFGTTVDILTPDAHTFNVDVGDDYKIGFDLDLAKQLMAQAGYENGFTVNLLVPAMYTKAAEVVQNNLEKIGITVELDVREISTWVAGTIEGSYDTVMGVYFPGNPDQLFYNLDNRIGTGAKNYCNFGTDEYHALLDTVYQTADMSKSADARAELIKIFSEECPGVALSSSNSLFGVKAGLTGFYTTTKGNQLHLDHIRPAA